MSLFKSLLPILFTPTKYPKVGDIITLINKKSYLINSTGIVQKSKPGFLYLQNDNKLIVISLVKDGPIFYKDLNNKIYKIS